MPETTLQFSADSVRIFFRMFGEGSFKGQRLGQAFYNHFKLYRVANQGNLCRLYESDGDKARGLIHQLFDISS